MNNWLRYRWYRFLWWLTEHTNYTPPHPLHVDIELCKQCNLKCTMCSYSDPAWSIGGMMDKEMAKNIIDQCVDLGVFSIKLQFRGESALHKDLVEIVKYAKNSGILEVQLNTNGIPYTFNKITGLIGNLDRLIVSVDGATPETYKKIRIGGKLEQVIKTLRTFKNEKKAWGMKIPKIRVQMTQQNDNDKEVELFKKTFKPLSDELIIKPVRSRNTGKRKSCPQPRQRLVYGWDGTVYGCCNAWNEESKIPGAGENIKGDWGMLKYFRTLAANPADYQPCQSCQVRSSYK